MPSAVEIVVKKAERRLYLTTSDGVKYTYAVLLGKNWTADKEIEGDHATPVGEFYVCAKNPRSKYFLSVCLSYPNAEDAERGLAAGLITAQEHGQIVEAIRLGKTPPQQTRLGGEIYIHGHAVEGTMSAAGSTTPGERDWTRGCIALDNLAMRTLYDLVAIGTPVRIVA